ncbi:hypothetical protein [Haloarcula halophila]|uniref:hypothetical protein n=1 Tax=Haloarcula TaxID=2237 RepID=UPI0023E3B561|nr:hypothetical protein [Halomicroarcula sp. DFY41]
MDRALPLAVLVGLAVGTVVTQVLDAGWYLALGTIPLYVGWSYFAVSYPDTLRASVFSFDRRADSLGYAAGVFGLSITALAIGHAAGGSGQIAPEVVVAVFGIIGFMYTLAAVLAVEPGVVNVDR